MSNTQSEWIPASQLAVMLGNVSAMTIWRWERDPKLTFPPPTVINGRKYWNRDDVNEWMRRRVIRKVA